MSASMSISSTDDSAFYWLNRNVFGETFATDAFKQLSARNFSSFSRYIFNESLNKIEWSVFFSVDSNGYCEKMKKWYHLEVAEKIFMKLFIFEQALQHCSDIMDIKQLIRIVDTLDDYWIETLGNYYAFRSDKRRYFRTIFLAELFDIIESVNPDTMLSGDPESALVDACEENEFEKDIITDYVALLNFTQI